MGECFFWYWSTRVVPDQRPLNGCVCVCECVCECVCVCVIIGTTDILCGAGSMHLLASVHLSVCLSILPSQASMWPGQQGY